MANLVRDDAQQAVPSVGMSHREQDDPRPAAELFGSWAGSAVQQDIPDLTANHRTAERLVNRLPSCGAVSRILVAGFRHIFRAP